MHRVRAFLLVCAGILLLAGALFHPAADAQAPTYLYQWGTYGTGDGQFNLPFGVAVDASGNVYVADYYNNRIQKFASDGTYVTQWGTYGGGDGQLRISAIVNTQIAPS